jgi:predicted nucleotidyltransferase
MKLSLVQLGPLADEAQGSDWQLASQRSAGADDDLRRILAVARVEAGRRMIQPAVTDIRRSTLSSMGVLQELAVDLDVEERTLRRAVSQGTLRATRSGPRRLRLAPGEREYLIAHWPLLSGLRRALRTEHGVRLAVLYGSLARGDEDAGSDLDLLVSLAGDRPSPAAKLAVRLEQLCGCRVDIADLGRVETRAPLLLDRVLDEGRVLIDRDEQWGLLRERHVAIRMRARRAHRHQMAGAARAIEELTLR